MTYMRMNNIAVASYVTLAASLAAGLWLIRFNVAASILPAAVMFGWFQIGGV